MYRNDKEGDITLGVYAEMSLADARRAGTKIRDAVALGVDTVAEKRRCEAREEVACGNTVRDVANAYLASRTRLAKSTQDRFRNRIEIDVFPVLWEVRLSDVERLDVLAATLPIAARGSIFTAKRVVGQLGHVFGYGMALGCEPDGRTLNVKEPDAQIILTFYEL